MCRRYLIPLLVLLCSALFACEPSGDAGDETRDSYSEQSEDSTGLNDLDHQDHTVSASEECGALTPLFALLPTDSSINGMPRLYRGCETAGEQSVNVAYEEAGTYSEYSYSVLVLDGQSPFAVNATTIDGASDEQIRFFENAVTAIGEMYKTRLDTCKEYAKNPVIQSERSPVVFQVQGIDVCIMDNFDANNEIWNALAIYKNLGFQLVFQGAKAEAIPSSQGAKAHLEPIFKLFRFDADIN